MTSIRRRLSSGLVAGSGLLLLAAASILNGVFSAWLTGELDRSLEERARVIAALTSRESAGVELDLDPMLMPEFSSHDRPDYFEMWVDGIGAFARSASLGDGDLARWSERAEDARFRAVTLPDGRAGRLVQVDFVPVLEVDDEGAATPSTASADGPAATVVVARSTEAIGKVLHAFRLTLAAVAALLLLGTLVLVPLAVGHGMEPLERLGAEVRALGPARLDARVGTAVPAELGPLVDRLNGLLERLEEAFERERQLTSDVAHELRTPVAELRTLAEVGKRWPEDRSAVVGFFDDVHAVALRMERLIGNLLALARHESGGERLELGDVDLVGLLACVRERLAPAAAQRHVTVELPPTTPPVLVTTDGARLETIVENLLTNAIEHGPTGATVTCHVGADPPDIRIVNPSPDLEPGDLPRLFERFWRKDGSRTGDGHAGIGLALVRALADSLGLEVVASLSPGGNLTMRVAFGSAAAVRLGPAGGAAVSSDR